MEKGEGRPGRRKKMNHFITTGIIIFSLIFIMGMGDLGGTAAVNQIPSPEKNFFAQVVDREGIETSLSQFSQDGKIFVTGKRGSATVAIPFDKISWIQFQNPEKGDVPVRLLLKDQSAIEIRLEKRSKFYGQAQFGTFQIEIKDVNSIRFHP
jgi:hypothetical protein